MFLISTKEKKLSSRFKNQLEMPKAIQIQIANGKTGLWHWKDKKNNIRVIGVTSEENLSDLFKGPFN